VQSRATNYAPSKNALLGHRREADEHAGGKSDPSLTWTAVYASDVGDDGFAADAFDTLAKIRRPESQVRAHRPLRASVGRRLCVRWPRGADAIRLLN